MRAKFVSNVLFWRLYEALAEMNSGWTISNDRRLWDSSAPLPETCALVSFRTPLRNQQPRPPEVVTVVPAWPLRAAKSDLALFEEDGTPNKSYPKAGEVNHQLGPQHLLREAVVLFFANILHSRSSHASCDCSRGLGRAVKRGFESLRATAAVCSLTGTVPRSRAEVRSRSRRRS